MKAKKTIALLVGMGLMLLGFPRMSHAQAAGTTSGPFSDVPAEHWAYQAVDTLQKAGIIVGYPDGTYGGKRALSRYEFSVAVARLLGLTAKPSTSMPATKNDLNALRDDMNTKLTANSQAVNDLQQAVGDLQPERQRLGQNEAAAKSRLDALEQRQRAIGGKR